jgi:hypothetical protein
MALPIFKTPNNDLLMMQTRWATDIDPVIDLPINSGVILKSVTLAAGDNSVSHKLGRVLQGWFVVRQRASATIYDKQDSNQHPELSLTLNASGAVVVDLFVF